MKVCAHYNTGPYQSHHARYGSIREAVREFRQTLSELGIETGDGEYYTLDVCPQCDDCDSRMNFHDYPTARYQLGPRGGISKVCV